MGHEMDSGISPEGTRNAISALLAEYNTLRTECQHRLTILIQSSLAGIAALSVVIGWRFTSNETGVQLYWASFIVVLYAAVLVLVDLNVRDITKRIRQIERQVNRLNGGKALLVWETKYGWGGAYPRSHKRLEKIDRALDALDE